MPKKLKADLKQVQRELHGVESLQSERDIVAHIDQICRKVKRNAREDDENAPERKRMQNSPPCGNLCLLRLVCLNDQQRFPCHRP